MLSRKLLFAFWLQTILASIGESGKEPHGKHPMPKPPPTIYLMEHVLRTGLEGSSRDFQHIQIINNQSEYKKLREADKNLYNRDRKWWSTLFNKCKDNRKTCYTIGGLSFSVVLSGIIGGVSWFSGVNQALPNKFVQTTINITAMEDSSLKPTKPELVFTSLYLRIILISFYKFPFSEKTLRSIGFLSYQ